MPPARPSDHAHSEPADRADAAAPARAGAPRLARPPLRVLLTLAGAAALLHALLLASVTAAEPAAGGAPAVVTMRVRTLPDAVARTAPPEAAATSPATDAVDRIGDTATLPVALLTLPETAPRRLPPAASPPSLPLPPAVATVRAGASAPAPAADAPAEPATDTAAEPADAVRPFESPPAAPATPDASNRPPPAAAMPLPAADTASAAIARPAWPERPGAGTAVAATTTTTPAATSTHGAGAPDTDAGNVTPARDDEMPVYKTVIPPPLTLHYDLRRGLLGGTGTLAWRPEGDHYEMRLEAKVAGISLLTQTSQGGFDDAGLAPRRYTDQRLSRAPLAANFNREAGKITFSGPSAEFPLLVGTQDRLSWMIQLAAVVSAEPRRLAPGGKVAIYVVGARADAAMWVFRSVGMETVDTPGGPVRATRFTREARDAHDTLAEAWLDAARHGVPVRARIGTGDGGDAVELLLRELRLP